MASREWDRLTRQHQELIQGHQAQLPVKLSAIARGLGLQLKASTLPAGVSGEIRPDGSGGFIVKVNRHDSSRRQRFTIAHEIAHYLLHRDQIGVGISDDALYRSSLSDAREAEANRLAADLLMPTNAVQAEVGNARRLQVEDIVSFVADKFEVSEAAMKIRLGLS